MGMLTVNRGNAQGPVRGGVSIGQQYTGGMRAPSAARVELSRDTDSGEQEVAEALSIGGQANPGIGLLVFGGLAVALTAAAQGVGEATDFGNIRGTAYNILWVSIIAAAGIPIWKYVFTRFKVPGVSTWVQAI